MKPQKRNTGTDIEIVGVIEIPIDIAKGRVEMIEMEMGGRRLDTPGAGS